MTPPEHNDPAGRPDKEEPRRSAAGHGRGAGAKGGPTVNGKAVHPSAWSQPVAAADRHEILGIHGLAPVTAALKEDAKKITDPIALKAFAVERQLPFTTRRDHVSAVRGIVGDQPGGSGFLVAFPELPAAVLFEVYNGLPSALRNATAIAKLDPEVVRESAQQRVPDIANMIYEDRLLRALQDINARPTHKHLSAIRQYMEARDISIAATAFDDEAYAAAAQVQRDDGYDSFFESGVLDDFDPRPSDTERTQAIALLRRLGVKAGIDDAPEWGRIALGLMGQGGDTDIMALASYGVGTDIGDLDAALDLPDFDDRGITGLKPDAIKVCADLYYIHKFDQLGVFRATDALAVKFFDNLNLGTSATAQRIYRYIKRRPQRFPDEDRQHITTTLFEHGPFRELMGRMVESTVEYMRVRNAGELFTSQSQTGGADPTAYTRSTVIRAVGNLQRYLSGQGGIAPFLARETGAQLKECFDILDSRELQDYYGGRYSDGMWGILGTVLNETDGHPPDVDRLRTLAVWGRKILLWLAANTANTSTLGDTEIVDLADRVQNWLAAYRRPELDPEPDWLHDDQPDDHGDLGTQMARDAARSALQGTPLAGAADGNGSGGMPGAGNGSAGTSDAGQPDVMSGVI